MESFSFDVDCGDVLPGHRLFATGLRVDGRSDDDDHAGYSEHRSGKPVHAMASLTYVITPALPTDLGGRDIDVRVRLTPPADTAFWPPVMSTGGEREEIPGATRTRGAFGPFILPSTTRLVMAELADVAVGVGKNAVMDVHPPRTLGALTVELATRTATWTPA